MNDVCQNNACSSWHNPDYTKRQSCKSGICTVKTSTDIISTKGKRTTKDEYYLELAKVVSMRSTCLVRRYGCVIVKDDVVVSTGYNGSPRGCTNCCDIGECKRKEFAEAKTHGGYDKCDAVHAEQNAIITASGQKLVGATVYLACQEKIQNIQFGEDGAWFETSTPAPCNICKNMLKNAKATRVVNRSGEICL